MIAARAAQRSAAGIGPLVLAPFSTADQTDVVGHASYAAQPAAYLPSPAVTVPAATQGMTEWEHSVMEESMDTDVEMVDVNDEEMPTEQTALVPMIPPVHVPAAFGATALDMEMDLDQPEVPCGIFALTTTTTDHELQMVEYVSLSPVLKSKSPSSCNDD